MLTVKILGVLLLLSVGGAAALICRRTELRRLRLLEGWIDLIRHVRHQISCYLLPLNEILSSVEPEGMEGCLASGEERLRAILRAGERDLEGESLRLLEDFVSQIGKGYREDQLCLCDEALAALGALRDKMAAELPARLRVCTTLCLCAAAGGALLLW